MYELLILVQVQPQMIVFILKVSSGSVNLLSMDHIPTVGVTILRYIGIDSGAYFSYHSKLTKCDPFRLCREFLACLFFNWSSYALVLIVNCVSMFYTLFKIAFFDNTVHDSLFYFLSFIRIEMIETISNLTNLWEQSRLLIWIFLRIKLISRVMSPYARTKLHVILSIFNLFQYYNSVF